MVEGVWERKHRLGITMMRILIVLFTLLPFLAFGQAVSRTELRNTNSLIRAQTVSKVDGVASNSLSLTGAVGSVRFQNTDAILPLLSLNPASQQTALRIPVLPFGTGVASNLIEIGDTNGGLALVVRHQLGGGDGIEILSPSGKDIGFVASNAWEQGSSWGAGSFTLRHDASGPKFVMVGRYGTDQGSSDHLPFYHGPSGAFVFSNVISSDTRLPDVRVNSINVNGRIGAYDFYHLNTRWYGFSGYTNSIGLNYAGTKVAPSRWVWRETNGNFLLGEAGGFVGVGTNNPAQALDVIGSGQFSGTLAARGGVSTISTQLNLGETGRAGSLRAYDDQGNGPYRVVQVFNRDMHLGSTNGQDNITLWAKEVVVTDPKPVNFDGATLSGPRLQFYNAMLRNLTGYGEDLFWVRATNGPTYFLIDSNGIVSINTNSTAGRFNIHGTIFGNGLASNASPASLLARMSTGEWVETAIGTGSGDVTAAATFGTDNVALRADGTGKGAQGSGVVISDSTNVNAHSFTAGNGFTNTGAAPIQSWALKSDTISPMTSALTISAGLGSVSAASLSGATVTVTDKTTSEKLTVTTDVVLPWHLGVAGGTVYATNGPNQIYNLGSHTNLPFAPLSGADASNSVPIVVRFTQNSTGGFYPTNNGAAINVRTNPNASTLVSYEIANGATNVSPSVSFLATVGPNGGDFFTYDTTTGTWTNIASTGTGSVVRNTTPTFAQGVAYANQTIAGVGGANTNFTGQATDGVVYVDGGTTNVNFVAIMPGTSGNTYFPTYIISNLTTTARQFSFSSVTNFLIPLQFYDGISFPITITNKHRLILSTMVNGSNVTWEAKQATNGF